MIAGVDERVNDAPVNVIRWVQCQRQVRGDDTKQPYPTSSTVPH